MTPPFPVLARWLPCAACRPARPLKVPCPPVVVTIRLSDYSRAVVRREMLAAVSPRFREEFRRRATLKIPASVRPAAAE